MHKEPILLNPKTQMLLCATRFRCAKSSAGAALHYGIGLVWRMTVLPDLHQTGRRACVWVLWTILGGYWALVFLKIWPFEDLQVLNTR